MTVREQHYHCGFQNTHIIDVSKYDAEKGLDQSYFFEIRARGNVPTVEEVEKARLEAFKQEKSTHHVVITYLDSESVPENSRNAPLDGHSISNERDDYGFLTFNKKRVSLDGDKFYDWKPITSKDVYDFRKKVKKLKR